MEKVTVAILAHNSEKTVSETIISSVNQNYKPLEVLILENGSTDNTLKECHKLARKHKSIRIKSTPRNLGLAGNMDRAKYLAKGSIIIFMCADDIFPDNECVGEYVKAFSESEKIGHVSRYYYQFIHGKKGKVRVHRSDNIYCLANNPSGCAFRTEAISGKTLEKPFIEAASMVKNTLNNEWEYNIIKKDLVAVRLGFNGASTLKVYKESPLMSWYNLIGYQDFIFDNPIGLIQLKNWASYRMLLKEIYLLIKFRPENLTNPKFIFFMLIALAVPKFILRPMTYFYKNSIARYFLWGKI